MVEYISFEPSQQTYAKKNFLYCEMEILNIIKRYQIYKKLRKEELALKSLLKKTVGEVRDEIKKFDSLLPTTKYDKFKPADISTSPKKRKDLESEIDAIKRKIAELS